MRERRRQTNPSGKRLGVLLAIHDERDRQEARWNPDGIPGMFPLPARLPVLVEEVGEVAAAMQDGDVEDLRGELVQVAAVAVRWIEALDALYIDEP